MSDDSTRVDAGWRVESLRLTAFPVPQSTPDAERWWRELLGPEEPPNQVVREPKTGDVQVQGTFKNSLLVMQAQVMRFELSQVLDAPQLPNAATPEFHDARPAFRDLALKWLGLDTCPALLRLAFGAVLTKPAENLEAGYDALRRYLPSVRLTPDSSDFLYQINRRRLSKTVRDLSINRLSKWSVQQSQELLLRNDGRVVRQPVELACRAELDVNSSPERTDALPREELPDLFDELVELTSELSIRGDVP